MPTAWNHFSSAWSNKINHFSMWRSELFYLQVINAWNHFLTAWRSDFMHWTIINKINHFSTVWRSDFMHWTTINNINHFSTAWRFHALSFSMQHYTFFPCGPAAVLLRIFVKTNVACYEVRNCMYWLARLAGFANSPVSYPGTSRLPAVYPEHPADISLAKTGQILHF